MKAVFLAVDPWANAPMRDALSGAILLPLIDREHYVETVGEWLREHTDVVAWAVLDRDAGAWERETIVERTEHHEGKRTYAQTVVRAVPEWLREHIVFVRDGLDEDDAAKVAAILGGL